MVTSVFDVWNWEQWKRKIKNDETLFGIVIFCTSETISKSAMGLRWRIPLQRDNRSKIGVSRKSSGVEKENENKVVLLWGQTRIIVGRSCGSVKTDVCPWDKNHVIYAFSCGHRLFP